MTTENKASQLPDGTLTFAGQAPDAVTTEHHISEIPSGAIALSGLAPNIITGDQQTSEIPSGAITFTGLAPNINTTEHHLIEIPTGDDEHEWPIGSGLMVQGGNYPKASGNPKSGDPDYLMIEIITTDQALLDDIDAKDEYTVWWDEVLDDTLGEG